MGGCASKPSDQDGRNPDALPSENPTDLAVKPVEAVDEPTTEAKTETAEKELKEEPLVDLSEPQPEAPSESAAVDDIAHEVRELKPEALLESGIAKEDEPSAKVAEAADAAAPETKKSDDAASESTEK